MKKINPQSHAVVSKYNFCIMNLSGECCHVLNERWNLCLLGLCQYIDISIYQ